MPNDITMPAAIKDKPLRFIDNRTVVCTLRRFARSMHFVYVNRVAICKVMFHYFQRRSANRLYSFRSAHSSRQSYGGAISCRAFWKRAPSHTRVWCSDVPSLPQLEWRHAIATKHERDNRRVYVTKRMQRGRKTQWLTFLLNLPEKSQNRAAQPFATSSDPPELSQTTEGASKDVGIFLWTLTRSSSVDQCWYLRLWLVPYSGVRALGSFALARTRHVRNLWTSYEVSRGEWHTFLEKLKLRWWLHTGNVRDGCGWCIWRRLTSRIMSCLHESASRFKTFISHFKPLFLCFC